MSILIIEIYKFVLYASIGFLVGITIVEIQSCIEKIKRKKQNRKNG